MSASGSSVSKLDPTPASAIPVTPLLLLAIEPQVANDNRLTMVLNIGQQDGPKPKCYFTHTALPSYIDNAHPPTKKEPFRTTLEQQYSHTLTLLLPASEAQQALHDKLATNDGVLRYARVYMKLIEIISGDFFNSYIKAGNIVMLSEGRVGTDNVFSLSDGILRMEVDKPTFERLGLEGKAVGSEGRKHVKARFVIELNLRLPSMLPGKKAFDRLIWACKNVLDSSLTWLFYDLRSPTDGQGPISAHAPTVKVVEPTAEPLSSVLCPTFPESIEEENRDEVAELLEWIQMTMARSPRVLQSDTVDPYICRYRPPEDSSPANLVLYQWHGFIPPAFGTKLLLAALKATGSSWFALGGEAFGGTKGYTVLRNGGNVMTWKYTD